MRPTSSHLAFSLKTLTFTLLAASLGVACSATTRTETTSSGEGGDGGEAWGATVGSGGAGMGSSTSTGTGGDQLQSLTHVDLGDVDLNVLKAFTVPDRTIGISVAVAAPDLNEVVGITRFRPPSGNPVVFNYAIPGKGITVFANYGWQGAQNPQSDLVDAWPIQTGDWRISLGDDDGSIKTGHVHVWLRRTMDGAFHGGVVDVNVLNASSTSQAYIQQVVDKIFSVADYAGLTIGNVNFLPLASSFSTVSNQAEYRDMLASSAGITDAPALNLFVINAFGSEFGQAIGVAGGIPGAPALHGTTMSGVAYMPSGNPDYDATVLRHEIGHLAGLFHTTEFSVDETDPLADTDSCPQAQIQSNPDNCPDVTNTMFPIAYGATDLTPWQKRVMQGSALYRGVIEAGGAPAPPLPPNAKAPAPSELVASPIDLATFALRRPNKAMPTNPSSLERVLGSVWCTHGHGDYEALALRVAKDPSPSVFRALVLDDKQPEIIRSRALSLYVRATKGDERALALELASDLAARESASTLLRLSALRSLARFAPSRASSAAQMAAKSTDVAVRDIALGMLRTK